jgi:hypothetical protein
MAQTDEAKLRAFADKMAMLNMEAERLFGADRWQRACSEGTDRGYLMNPLSDPLTRELIDRGDPRVIYAIGMHGDRLRDKLQGMSEAQAADWIRAHADELAEMIADEDLTAEGLVERRERQRSAPAETGTVAWHAEQLRKRRGGR